MTDDPTEPAPPSRPPDRSPWETPSPDQPPFQRPPAYLPPSQSPYQPQQPPSEQQPYGAAPPYQSPYVPPHKPSPYDPSSYEQQPYGPQYWQGQPPSNTGTNRFAIASLILGIIWLFWLGSGLAIIFGHIALAQIKRSGQSGRGMALAGLILGYIAGFAILASLIAYAFVASGPA